MSSSRLPGKVLLDIAGQPMLVWVCERARQAKLINQVMVATTTDPADDAVEELCHTRGYHYYRGSHSDVLDRYYHAACSSEAEVIVRITADCPLIDPGVIDDTIQAFSGQPVQPDEYITVSEKSDPTRRDPNFVFDFAANRLPPPWSRSFPIGLDVEVCTFQALEEAWRNADQPHQREHVMPYLYEEPGRYRYVQLHHIPDYGTLRLTVDTKEDLDLVRQIVQRLPDHIRFNWLDVVDLLAREPELVELNAQVIHRTYRDFDERLQDGNNRNST